LSTEIDWQELASKLNLLHENGEGSGSKEALRALESILGEDTLRRSVDYYIDRRPGSELARSVLWQLRPWSAMSYCYEIFKSTQGLDNRRAAIELLRVVADARALPWIHEFLKDDDPTIQFAGICVLDQLLFSALVDPEDAGELLREAEAHQNGPVNERAKFIRTYLCDRADDQTTDGVAIA
jgi:hypothetical protein